MVTDGFLGAQSSRLRCLPIAESTLGLGRAMLERAKHLIEIDDGSDTPDLPQARAKVIYGDTDSVFVEWEGLSVAQAKGKAKAAAAMVTRRINRAPIELEYEKTYRSFVIQQIKRYAGAIVSENPAGNDAEDDNCDIKGFESQQRDTPLYISRAVRDVLHALTVGGGPRPAAEAAVRAIHSVLGRRHHQQDLAFTRALKMWESQAQASPHKKQKGSKSGGAAAVVVKDKTKLYDMKTSHVALAARIEQQHGGAVQFESGQRVSFVYCAHDATTAQRASTAQKKPPLFERATDPFAALSEGRSVDWEEALRQLCLPLQRLFCLPGVIDARGGERPRDWEALLKLAQVSFEAETRAAPWRATHNSGGGGGSGGGGSSGSAKAAKGTLGAFFKVARSTLCVICNKPASGASGSSGVCGTAECNQKVGTVCGELEQQAKDAQTLQRVCVAQWRQCLGGCDAKRWSASGSGSAAAAGGWQCLEGCENVYVDLPYRMAAAVQAERRAVDRLQRLTGGDGGR